MKRTSVAGLQAAKGNSKDAKKRHFVAPKDRGHLYALRDFSCPLCQVPNSLNIKLSVSKGEGEAVFSCVECKQAGRPGAGTIMYPYRMQYHAKLQKRVDVYFRFRDYVSQVGLTGIFAHAKQSSDAKHENAAATVGEAIGQAGMLSGFLDENGVERSNDNAQLPPGDDDDEAQDEVQSVEGVNDAQDGSRAQTGISSGSPSGVLKESGAVRGDDGDGGMDDDGAFDDLFGGGDDPGDS